MLDAVSPVATVMPYPPPKSDVTPCTQLSFVLFPLLTAVTVLSRNYSGGLPTQERSLLRRPDKMKPTPRAGL